LYLKPTKNGNKAKGQPEGTKSGNNFKPCINRPNIITSLRIRAYMDSLDMDHLLLTNQFKFSINIVKIIMKTKDRIKYNPIFAKEMCILSIKDATKDKKSRISNWLSGFKIILYICIY